MGLDQNLGVVNGGSRPERSLSRLLLLSVALLVMPGCEVATQDATGAHPSPPSARPGLVRLSAETASAAGIIVQPVRREEFWTFREFPGTVEPDQHYLADITPLVRGRVVDVYADLGQDVKAGSLLAVLYSSELGMAQSVYLKALASLYVAERAYQRARTLLREKIVGLGEAQRREGAMISARADKREAHDQLLLLGMSDREIRRLDREQSIRSQVSIVAPFDGRVIARNLTKGEVVETTARIFVVADLSDVWVTANIPEKDIPYVHAGQSGRTQTAEVRVAAYPDAVFEGRITYVGDVLDPVTRTMQLRLELSNHQRKLKPQMFATVRLYSEPESNVLVVPESAVQRDRDRRFVFVQREPHSYEMRNVVMGESNGQVFKVLSGLQEGDPVVVTGAFILKSELIGEQL